MTLSLGGTSDEATVPVPTLQCTPGSVTRGYNVTCTVSGAAATRVTGWTFSYTGGEPINGPSGVTSWGGAMVQGGTVSVNVSGFGSLQQSITVNNRSGWHTQPASHPVPVANGSLVVNGQTFTLPVPPQRSGNDAGLGFFGWQATYSPPDGASFITAGPNTGFGFYASPLSFTTFFAKYTINPDLLDSGSVFAGKQWGACGFISYSDLLTQTRRHEYNHTTQSHYGKYVSAMNDQSNNLGDYLESRVASPNSNLSQFDQATGSGLQSRGTNIENLTSAQPYPVNYSETNQPLGNVNYDEPYVGCP